MYKFTPNEKKYDYSWSRLIIIEGTIEEPKIFVKNGSNISGSPQSENNIEANLKFNTQYFAWIEIDWE